MQMRATKTTWNNRYSDPNITSAILSAIFIVATFTVAESKLSTNVEQMVNSALVAFIADGVVISCDVISGHDVISGDVTWSLVMW